MTIEPDSVDDQARPDPDGVDRRGFLRCMAWAGTATAWTVAGGVLTSCGIGAVPAAKPTGAEKDLFFVQVSDSHIGFQGPQNPDVAGTYQTAIDKINGLPERPAFVVHTGDLTHLSTAAQFDTVGQLTSGIRTGGVKAVPGEHDGIDDGKAYMATFGKGSKGTGWHTFDVSGVHFLALSNSFHVDGLGRLGQEQLDFIKNDLGGRSAETPLVVISHIPLFAMYPDWGWATEDAVQALGHMRRFGAVTALNGHVHQTFTKVEGNITFHSGRATGLVSPRPGEADSPKPIVLPSKLLHNALGIREARFKAGQSVLALVDDTL